MSGIEHSFMCPMGIFPARAAAKRAMHKCVSKFEKTFSKKLKLNKTKLNTFSAFQDDLIEFWKYPRRKSIKQTSENEIANTDNGISNSVMSNSTGIHEDTNMDTTDALEDQSFSSQTSQMVYRETTHHSIDGPASIVSNEPVEHISRSSSHSQRSSMQWNSSESIDMPSPPNPQDEHTIISFHSVSGKIESFGTSIFIKMHGKIVS